MTMVLRGVCVVVTRPSQQAGRLLAMVRAQGGVAHALPCMEIVNPPDVAQVQQQLRAVSRSDWAIFISRNAVDRSHALVPDLFQDWPASVRIAAVGRGTAAALAVYKATVAVMPAQRFDAEGLLALPAFQTPDIAGRQVALIRGQGGRQRLPALLRQRGANLKIVECYRRQLPGRWPESRLYQIRQQAAVFTLTSVDALRGLLAGWPDDDRPWLLRQRLAVLSQRIAQAARERGFLASVVVADEASDLALVKAIYSLVLHG